MLVVSHTYTASINCAKLDALAQLVSLTAIIPARWEDTLFTNESSVDPNPNYVISSLPIRFDGHILRYHYPFRAIDRILRETLPDLVLVEEEPASLALAQFAWLKRNYKLVFFTWENIFHMARLPVLEQWNISRCDGAIAGNTDAAQILRQKKFSKLVTVIPQLGIDLGTFSSVRTGSTRDHFVVGYIGRLVKEKGLWTLLRAVEVLEDVRVVLVGAGPLREDLGRWIESRQLTNRIEIRAAVPHQDVPRILNEFDVLVLPSQTTERWKEQFGHILIEAMACGVPVIGANSGAIPEVIADAGIVFPEANANALRDAIIALQKNPALRAKFAEAGRARVLGHYTHAHIAAQNADFFRRIISQT